MDTSELRVSGRSAIVGKVLYGTTFVVVLPLALVAWAALTETRVLLAPIKSVWLGSTLLMAGFAIMIGGMTAIIVHGKGLPMNAYPPARLVVESVYRYLSHPIYVGFSILCFGVAIFTGSASGLWLVAPIVSLGCLVLVEGYEKEATIRHFNGARSSPYLRLPRADRGRPAIADRVSALTFSLVPFVLFNLIANRLAGGLSVATPADSNALPDLAWRIVPYLAGMLAIALGTALASTSLQLRTFVTACSAALGSVALFSVALPHYASRAGLALSASFILIAAYTLSNARSLRTISLCAASAALGLAYLTGLLRLIEILLASLIFAASISTGALWVVVRHLSERIANSWREWTFGPIRVINHGFYAAAGAFVSLFIISLLVGPEYIPFVLMITFLSITMSALSAQWIEGSPRLLRPFGWYGGVIGAFLGALITFLLGGDTWLLIAAFCVGAPFVQAAGRLRCLVQGCCHGRPTDESIGIRYRLAISRVCRIADLKDTPLHATQLYSIGYNFIVAVIMLRLWFSGTSLSLIVGIYYILTGMGRFVEESYRGEPQTPRYGGLRLYQIFAVFSIIGGIGATMIQGTGNAVRPVFSWEAIIAAALFGVFVCIAFGVDFPGSQRRFARLT